MLSLENRLLLYINSILSKKKDGDLLCPNEYNILNNDILLIQKIGSGVFGQAYISCKPYNKLTDKCDNNNILLSSKKMIVRTNIHNINAYFNNQNALRNHHDDTIVELMSMKLCRFILLNPIPICPNLPLYYNFFVCNDCNKNLQEKKKQIKTLIYTDKNGIPNSLNLYLQKLQKKLKNENQKTLDSIYLKKVEDNVGKDNAELLQYIINNPKKECVLLTNEYANEGDLKKWLQTSRNETEWSVMYFQVFAGLYALQKYFDLTHHDLHWGNILVHKINNSDEFLYYKINETYFKIPNIGYLFTLWDFGFARIPLDNIDSGHYWTFTSASKMQAFPTKYYMHQHRSLNRYTEDYFRISNAIKWISKINKQTNKSNGPPAPSKMHKFFNKIDDLHQKAIPLHFIFRIIFKDYIINTISNNIQPYIIDDINVPQLPDEYKWLLNNNNNYKKTYHMDIDIPSPISTLSYFQNQMDITNQNHNYLHQIYETNGHTTLNIPMEID
jgi:hypothetical protein